VKKLLIFSFIFALIIYGFIAYFDIGINRFEINVNKDTEIHILSNKDIKKSIFYKKYFKHLIL